MNQRVVYFVEAVLANSGGNAAILARYKGTILNLHMLVPQFQPLAVALLNQEKIAYLAAVNNARGRLSSLTLGLATPDDWKEPRRTKINSTVQAAIYCARPVAIIGLPDYPDHVSPLGGL